MSAALDARDWGLMPQPYAGVRRTQSIDDLPINLPGPSRSAAVHSFLTGSLPAMNQPPRRQPFWHGIPTLQVPSFLQPANPKLRIAPLGLRLYLEFLMLVRRDLRGETQTLRLPVDFLAACLWPGDTYRPGRRGEQLHHALYMAHNIRLPWRLNGQDGHWSAVVVRWLPGPERDGVVIVEVTMPPGSHRGPLVYRPTLRRYGADSVLCWRLYLSLVWMWDHYLTGGKAPGMNAIPVVSRGDLIRLATGAPENSLGKYRRRQLLRQSFAALERISADGWAEPEYLKDGIRLLPRRVSGFPDVVENGFCGPSTAGKNLGKWEKPGTVAETCAVVGLG